MLTSSFTASAQAAQHTCIPGPSLTPVLWEHWPVRMVVREGQQSAKSVMYCVKLAPAW